MATARSRSIPSAGISSLGRFRASASRVRSNLISTRLRPIGPSRPARQERRVAMSGLGLFCGQVAEQIERCEPGWKASILRTGSRLEVLAAMYRLISSDVWYSIGSPITDRWVNAFARALRKPRVIHWVGTDIEHFRNAPGIASAFASPHTKHLTEAPWTALELRELGLESTIAPLPLRSYAADVKPLPARFTILLYVPQSRPDFYGRQLYESMLREFSAEGLRVYVVGGGELQAPAGADVSHFGWQDDLRRIYEDTTVLVRLTPRDGLSLMVLEALSFGRHVIWSQPFAARSTGTRRTRAFVIACAPCSTSIAPARCENRTMPRRWCATSTARKKPSAKSWPRCSRRANDRISEH